MTGFSTDWLALREPADQAARDEGLVAQLNGWAASRPKLQIIDLGSGTGSSFRALSPGLSGAGWTLVDHDPALLAEAERRIGAGARYRQADLATGLEEVLSGVFDIVTGSALIDLCSAAWLDRLAAALPRDAALYMALSYDGTENWVPAHPSEPAALAAFHAHQAGDKGFGPALGPAAPDRLAAALETRGWDVTLAPSPWRLSAVNDGPLIAALADGTAAAVAETGALDPATHGAWHAARRAADSVTVGHLDLLALPG